MFRPSLLMICALLAAALTVTGGCGGGNSARVASSSRSDLPERNGAKVTGTFSVGFKSSSPSSLPEYLCYPGAQAQGDMDWDVDSVGTSLNVFKTTDSVPAVIAHYESLLAGWKDNPVSAHAGTSIGRTSPDGRQTVIVTAKHGTGDSTTFSIYRVFSDQAAGKP